MLEIGWGGGVSNDILEIEFAREVREAMYKTRAPGMGIYDAAKDGSNDKRKVSNEK